MTSRDRLHRLVDELPEENLAQAQRLLTILQNTGDDYVLRVSFSAPPDDEPLTPEDIADTEEGKPAISRGDYLSWDDTNEHLRASEAE